MGESPDPPVMRVLGPAQYRASADCWWAAATSWRCSERPHGCRIRAAATATSSANTKDSRRYQPAASPRSSRRQHPWPKTALRTSSSPESGRADRQTPSHPDTRRGGNDHLLDTARSQMRMASLCLGSRSQRGSVSGVKAPPMATSAGSASGLPCPCPRSRPVVRRCRPKCDGLPGQPGHRAARPGGTGQPRRRAAPPCPRPTPTLATLGISLG